MPSLIAARRTTPKGRTATSTLPIRTWRPATAIDPGYSTKVGSPPGGVNNVLPGTNDDGASDGPDGEKQLGFIWDSVLKAGLTVRDYGVLGDNGLTAAAPLVRYPASTNTVMMYPTNPRLIGRTDPYFRGFDNAYPDVWREEEWEREFGEFEQNGNLPSLSIVGMRHDHMGSFATAVPGFNTPETQQADNDLATARLIEAVAHSERYASNTLIFILENDAQDGPDHMNAHRSTAYVVGPYVKRHAVVSTRYSTVSMLRTIEDVLGLDHLNFNDAHQPPMTDVFDLSQQAWNYHAVASTVLEDSATSLPPTTTFAEGPRIHPAHDATYCANETKGFDWSGEDRAPAGLFNRVLWEGLMPGRPDPAVRDGLARRQSAELIPPVAPTR